MKKALIVSVLLSSVTALGFSQTAYAVRNTATWIEAVNGIRSGGNSHEYTITVTGTVSVPAAPSNENTFGDVTGVTVTIEGSGTLSPSNNGSLLRIGKDQTIVAKDLTLKGRDANNASVVNILCGGIFHMKGKASVTGNTSSDFYSGGGVYVNGGTFTMQDSVSVSGNTSSSNSSSGGGVYVRGTFAMSGGTISGNTSSSYDSSGGGVYVNGGTFTMSGGTISGNTSTTSSSIFYFHSYSYSSGGGVYVAYQGTFTMQDSASVSGNTSTTTSSSSNSSSGGGVYVGGGTFTMQDDASVSGNTAYYGGGVYVGESGTFTMQGGTVSGNTAASQGGGVYMSSSNRTFAKTGGTIYGDDAEQKLKNTAISGKGHAVYEDKNKGWRNAGAGPTINPNSYGFWLNEEP
jgi:hypothetical protein